MTAATPSTPTTPSPTPISTPTWKSALTLLNESKWWFAPLASIISILLLAKYLWIIGHAELLLETLGSPSTLFVWLAFAILGFSSVLIVLAIPSVFLSFTMNVAEVKEQFRGQIVIRFVGLSLLNFAFFTFYILWSSTETFITWLPFLASLIFSAAGVWRISTQPYGSDSFRKPKTEADSESGYHWDRLVIVTGLIWMTACSGLFPAQIALLAWRGAEEGTGAALQIGGCFMFLMASCLFAPFMYFVSKETREKRLRNALYAFAGTMAANLIVLPQMMDVGLFTGAGMLKLRDARVAEYVLDSKDYPPALFSRMSWSATALQNGEGLYSVRAFRQFQFGDVVLLCPGRYAAVPLKDVDRYSRVCVSVSAAMIRFSSLLAVGALLREPAPRCLVPAPTSVQVPRLISPARDCALSL